MKKTHTIFLMLLAGMFTGSCKKFLTVNPKTEISRDVLFSTEKGFKDALAGIYIQLVDDAAYGQALTTTTLEYLVSSWDAAATTPAGQLGLFQFADAGAEGALSAIFEKQYNIIAGVNAILEQIDTKKDVFSPNMYELIKGECLAVRAYVHFDLIRLFGPVPNNISTGNQLPYVTKVSKTPTPAVDYTTFKKALLKDLTDAEMLLKAGDPFQQYSIVEFKNGTYKPKDDFLNYRYLHMNYYAAKALQARACLWFNEPEKAFQAAKFLIDEKNKDGSPKFRLGKSSDFAAEDYVLTCEHIFGLYDFNFNLKYASNRLTKDVDKTLVNGLLYGNTGVDIRESNLWEQYADSYVRHYVFRKYKVKDAAPNLLLDYKQIPMLRISEMYFIAIETAEQLSEAQDLWNAFLASRNLLATNLPSDLAQKQELLLMEYRKELIGEGQAFYAYKRNDASRNDIVFAPPIAIPNYMPPLPKIEATTIK